MSARIDPKRILILWQQVGRMDAWNAFGRTRGTAANCGIRCARTRHWGRRQIVGCNAPNMIMRQLARKRYVPSSIPKATASPLASINSTAAIDRTIHAAQSLECHERRKRLEFVGRNGTVMVGAYNYQNTLTKKKGV